MTTAKSSLPLDITPLYDKVSSGMDPYQIGEGYRETIFHKKGGLF